MKIAGFSVKLQFYAKKNLTERESVFSEVCIETGSFQSGQGKRANQMGKITAYIWEHEDGSDDSRAVQGGGGDSSRLIETRTNSLWLIELYVKILNFREGAGSFSFSVACFY